MRHNYPIDARYLAWLSRVLWSSFVGIHYQHRGSGRQLGDLVELICMSTDLIYIYIYRNSIMWRLCDFLACWWKKFCTCSTIGSLYTCLFSTQATEQQSQAPQAPMVGEGIPCNQSYFYTINSLFNPGGGGSLGYNAASCAHEPWRLRLGTLVMSRFTRVGKQWIWNP